MIPFWLLEISISISMYHSIPSSELRLEAVGKQTRLQAIFHNATREILRSWVRVPIYPFLEGHHAVR
jgi:hypothetical protein